MYSLKQVFGLVTSSLYTLLFSKKFVIFIAVAFIFSFYTFGGLNDIAVFYNTKVSAYVFPFFLSNPSVLLIFGALVIYIFSDLPFTEQNAYFVIIRTNRIIYYLAKILYTFFSSIVVVATFVLFSIISIIPNADFSNQWGKVINTLSSNPQTILEHTQAKIGFAVHDAVVYELTPFTAMAYSIVLMVLVVFFVGIVIMFGSVVVSPNAGYIVSGFFVCLSYFSAFLGYITFGGFLYFISPFSWCSLNWLDIHNSGLTPSPLYAVIVIICVTAILEILSFLKFNNTDLKL